MAGWLLPLQLRLLGAPPRPGCRGQVFWVCSFLRCQKADGVGTACSSVARCQAGRVKQAPSCLGSMDLSTRGRKEAAQVTLEPSVAGSTCPPRSLWVPPVGLSALVGTVVLCSPRSAFCCPPPVSPGFLPVFLCGAADWLSVSPLFSVSGVSVFARGWAPEPRPALCPVLIAVS